MAFCYFLIVFALGGIFYLSLTKSVITLTITDLAVFVFLLYSLLHIAIVQHFGCDPLVWFKWGAVVLCYFFFRKLKKPYVVLYGLVLYGLFQAIMAIGQSLLLFQSTHHIFFVTGTIGNPGPLGSFLSISLVCAIGLLRALPSQQRIRLIIWILAICILLAGLLLTDSRAAFLSLTIGLVILWGDWVWELFNKHKLITIITFSVAVVLLCCFLYQHRPGSADARMLIWRVSSDMIVDKPLFGHGIGAFDREYMLYQADYFVRHPQSHFTMVANNVAYPYNELIHVTMELGMVGVCLLLAVFVAGFASRSPDRLNRMLKAGLAAFIVFSCFSYPVEVPELLLLPAILLGSLPGKPMCILPIRRWTKFVSMVLLTGVIFLSVTGISVLRNILEEIRQLTVSETPISTPYCDRYFSILKYNANFNMSYLPALCNLPCQQAHWQKIQYLFPSSESFCLLGEVHECYGQDERAEELYRQAYNMVPTRILPNYHLWKLYVKRGDCEQANAMAQKILSQPLKVENTFTLQVKGEIKRYLELRTKS